MHKTTEFTIDYIRHLITKRQNKHPPTTTYYLYKLAFTVIDNHITAGGQQSQAHRCKPRHYSTNPIGAKVFSKSSLIKI